MSVLSKHCLLEHPNSLAQQQLGQWSVWGGAICFFNQWQKWGVSKKTTITNHYF